MKVNRFIKLGVLTLSSLATLAEAVPDPGPVSGHGPDGTHCTADPNSSSGWACYNPGWISIADVKRHLNYSLFLGGHNGKNETRRGGDYIQITENHCAKDVLHNNLEAVNRNLWTLKCEYTKLRILKRNIYSLNDLDEPELNPVVNYPIFGKKVSSGNWEVYPLGRREMDYRSSPCNLPPEQQLLSQCEAGCFSGLQETAYFLSDGEHYGPVSEVPEFTKISALTPTSSLDDLSTATIAVQNVKEVIDSKIGGEVFHLFIEGSTSPDLRVTANHPIVNQKGHFISAVDLKVGDQVLTLNGPRKISRIEKQEYNESLYNFLPESKNIRENMLIVGDSFIVGSKRVQRKEFKNMQRAIAREQIEVDS